MGRGRFISFEGGEGTGKSTQIGLLADRLRGRDIDVIVTREPGGTPGAEIVRRAVLSGRVAALGPFAEAVLMNAARDDHLNEVIRPALASGKWVLSDRFADSTRAYQGALGGVEPGLLGALERVVVGADLPDLTLVLDLDPAIGLERARAATRGAGGEGGGDRFEDEDLDAHRRLREAFLSIARDNSRRCVVIEAGGPVDRVAQAVWAVVSSRFLPAEAARSGAA